MTCNICEPNHPPGTISNCQCLCHLQSSYIQQPYPQSPISLHPIQTKPDQKTRPAAHTHCFCKSKDIDGILHEVCCMCSQRRMTPRASSPEPKR